MSRSQHNIHGVPSIHASVTFTDSTDGPRFHTVELIAGDATITLYLSGDSALVAGILDDLIVELHEARRAILRIAAFDRQPFPPSLDEPEIRGGYAPAPIRPDPGKPDSF